MITFFDKVNPLFILFLFPSKLLQGVRHFFSDFKENLFAVIYVKFNFHLLKTFAININSNQL